jgi:hypothetical protein
MNRFAALLPWILAELVLVSDVQAESVADAVRQHVKTGLEGSNDQNSKPAPKQALKASEAKAATPVPPPATKPAPPVKPPPPVVPQPRRDPSPPAASKPLVPGQQPPPGLSFQWGSASDNKDPAKAPEGPAIPQRVFGKYLLLDPKIGGGLRGWIPQQYPTVSVKADTYFTWSVDFNATLLRYINIHRGYYESNGIAGPVHRGAAVTVETVGYAKKAAWLLGVVGVPINKTWEPIARYEARAFQTRAIPDRPVRIVPFNTPPNTDLSTIPATTNPLTMVSGFETLVVGVRYVHSGNPSATIGQNNGVIPPVYFGVGFTQYAKPYQVTVGDSVLDSVLFDARFRGAGLALGTNLPSKPDYLILDAAVQFGIGEVRLLDKLTLNELLPNEGTRGGLRPPKWLIGYVEGDLSIGYLYTLLRTKPSVLVSAVANGGGARFFYLKTQSEQGEKVNMPSLNWDFLWGVRAYVTVPF